MSLTVGKVYLLKGGHVLRYQGFYCNSNGTPGKGPNLAFRCVQEGVTEPATGYSAAPGDVLREITAADRDWLKSRRENAQARNLSEDVADMDLVLRELA